ncbi:MAG: hypothetical protein ACI8ZF_000784 [Candidatus Midichloriaceae bacterium]|jgi:hypothetical protein
MKSLMYKNIKIHSIWEFKEIVLAVKNGATKDDLNPLELESGSSTFTTVMDDSIMECSRWRKEQSAEKNTGAFGCAHKDDVLYLLEHNVIEPCSSDRSLAIANTQYTKSQGQNYFNFQDWSDVCGFTEEQITNYLPHDSEEL